MSPLNLSLVLLLEELGESAQAASKVIRFGPTSGFRDTTNAKKLENELGDVVGCIQLLHNNGLIDITKVSEQADKKLQKILNTHGDLL